MRDESMNRHTPLRPGEAVKAKLQQVAEGLPQPPPWLDAVRQLSDSSTDEERLAAYQAVRDSGVLPPEVGFNLVAAQIDDLAIRLRQPKLREFERRLREITEAHGLDEDELWDKGEEPPEYGELFQQYHVAWNQLYLAELFARGEQEIAELFRDNRREYERRLEVGRKFLFGALTDNDERLLRWAHALVDEVAGCVEAISPMGPLGYHYHSEAGFVELTVYATPVELVGGRDDGGLVDSDFNLDVGRLCDVFDEVACISWNALGLNDDGGSNISFEAKFRGQDVFLRVLAMAPEGADPPNSCRDYRPRRAGGSRGGLTARAHEQVPFERPSEESPMITSPGGVRLWRSGISLGNRSPQPAQSRGRCQKLGSQRRHARKTPSLPQ